MLLFEVFISMMVLSGIICIKYLTLIFFLQMLRSLISNIVLRPFQKKLKRRNQQVTGVAFVIFRWHGENHGSSDELSVRSPRPQQQQHHLFLTWKIRPRREPFKKRHHKKRWTRCEVCRRILLLERLVRRRYRYLYQQVSRRHNSSDVAGLLHSSEISEI